MSDPTDLLIRLHRACRLAWAENDAGLSHSEFDYLDVIHREVERQRFADDHGRHLGDIVDGIGVTRASASAMIGKLETRGLVQRFQCRQDARAQHITLTEEGRRRLDAGRALYREVAGRFGLEQGQTE